MAEKRNLFPVASALGKTMSPSAEFSAAPEAEAASPSRFALLTQSGGYWSYPYACVGLIEQPSADLIVLHGSCSLVESILIRGLNLRPLAEELTAQRVVAIKETAHSSAVGQDVCAVWEIVVRTIRPADEPERPGLFNAPEAGLVAAVLDFALAVKGAFFPLLMNLVHDAFLQVGV